MPSAKLPCVSKDVVGGSQDFLTIDELAEQLKVPKSWIYSRTRLVGPGAFPRLRVGKYLRFRLASVLDWLERQQDEN
jgi:excisionase family DNA binding protein